MAIEEKTPTIKRAGDARQALIKLSTPPPAGTATAAPAPGAQTVPTPAPAAVPATGTGMVPAQGAPVTRPAPAPNFIGNGAGETMTRADVASRAALGNTPDVAAASRARLAGAPVAPVAPAPVSPLAGATTTPGAAPPMANSATRLAGPAAPNWSTAAGAAGPEAINPDVTRSARVAPAAAPNWTVGQPAAAPPPAGAPAASGGGTLGRVARMGASPVETVPGRVGPRTAPGQRGASGALLAGAGFASASDSIMTPTENYMNRFGVDPKTVDQSTIGGMATELGVRAGGVLTDFGNSLLDMGLGPVNMARRIGGAEPLPSFGEIGRGMDTPYDAAVLDARRKGERPPYPEEFNGTMPPAGTPAAGQPDFSNVTSTGRGEGSTAARVDIPRVPRGPGAADPSTWGENSRAALESSAPGTAVINGQSYTKEQLEQLGKRNVVSSEGFRNPSSGALAMETGRGVLNMGEGPTRGNGGGFTQADRDQQLANILAGPDKRVEQAAEAQRKARESLADDARGALRSGKRKTAGKYIDLLNAVNSGADADARANRPQRQPAGRTDSQEALTAAQTEAAQTQTASSRQKLLADGRIGQLQDALLTAETPQEQAGIARSIALLTGRDLPQKKVNFIEVPVGDPALGQTQRLPYDPETNEIIMPKGLSGIYADAQGNQQRR